MVSKVTLGPGRPRETSWEDPGLEAALGLILVLAERSPSAQHSKARIWGTWMAGRELGLFKSWNMEEMEESTVSSPEKTLLGNRGT